MKSRADHIRRYQQLLAKAHGTTNAHEAETFRSAARRYQRQHRLTKAELRTMDSRSCRVRVGTWSKLVIWELLLGEECAKLCACRFVKVGHFVYMRGARGDTTDALRTWEHYRTMFRRHALVVIPDYDAWIPPLHDAYCWGAANGMAARAQYHRQQRAEPAPPAEPSSDAPPTPAAPPPAPDKPEPGPPHSSRAQVKDQPPKGKAPRKSRPKRTPYDLRESFNPFAVQLGAEHGACLLLQVPAPAHVPLLPPPPPQPRKAPSWTHFHPASTSQSSSPTQPSSTRSSVAYFVITHHSD